MRVKSGDGWKPGLESVELLAEKAEEKEARERRAAWRELELHRQEQIRLKTQEHNSQPRQIGEAVSPISTVACRRAIESLFR